MNLDAEIGGALIEGSMCSGRNDPEVKPDVTGLQPNREDNSYISGSVMFLTARAQSL